MIATRLYHTCCVTMNELPKLSKPFLELANGTDSRDSAYFAGLSLKKVLFIHWLHICCALSCATGLHAWDT